MDIVSIISLVASIASLILAIIAIWLSFVFYNMSSKAAKDADTASKNIEMNVKKLDIVFDKLYSDTFSMMKDTVSDMRDHIWKNPKSENHTIELGDDVKKEIDKSIKTTLSNTNLSNPKKESEMSNEMVRIFSRKLKTDTETGDEFIKEKIMQIMSEKKNVTAQYLLKTLPFNERKIILSLFELRKDKYIIWEGGEDNIGYHYNISLVHNSN